MHTYISMKVDKMLVGKVFLKSEHGTSFAENQRKLGLSK